MLRSVQRNVCARARGTLMCNSCIHVQQYRCQYYDGSVARVPVCSTVLCCSFCNLLICLAACETQLSVVTIDAIKRIKLDCTYATLYLMAKTM